MNDYPYYFQDHVSDFLGGILSQSDFINSESTEASENELKKKKKKKVMTLVILEASMKSILQIRKESMTCSTFTFALVISCL